MFLYYPQPSHHHLHLHYHHQPNQEHRNILSNQPTHQTNRSATNVANPSSILSSVFTLHFSTPYSLALSIYNQIYYENYEESNIFLFFFLISYNGCTCSCTLLVCWLTDWADGFVYTWNRSTAYTKLRNNTYFTKTLLFKKHNSCLQAFNFT